MADVFSPYILRTYKGFWNNNGSTSFGFFTSDNFPPGTNVYVSTAISNSHADDNAVAHGFGLSCHAFIFDWSVYGAGGQITPVHPDPDPFRNAVYINDCANITIGFGAGGGYCGTLATVFRR
jgi:hypothetical protein